MSKEAALRRLLEEQAANQERLLAEFPGPPDELLNELAEQSARAAEMLLAELDKQAE